LSCLQPDVPFNITKTGPGLVKAGQAFNFDILVVIKGPTTGLIITDDMPVGLTPGAAPATWTAQSSVPGNPTSGSKCCCSIMLFGWHTPGIA
jgi:hypothetical protein